MGFLVLLALRLPLLVFVVRQCYLAYGTIDELSWPNADKVVQAVCPNKDICGIPPSDAKDVNTCCEECSCDADCGTTQKCCFNNDQSRADYETCFFPRSKHNREYLQSKSESFSHSYYMVNKEPATGCVNGHSDGCNSKDPGLMAPVTSSNMITFFNANCALCHGVKDFEEWENVLICDRLGSSLPLDFEQEVTKFLLNPESSVCFMYYFLPNARDTISCKIPPPKRAEHIDERMVDFAINISDIYRACISTMENPVYSLTTMMWYSNPFCLVYTEGFPGELGDILCKTVATETFPVDYTSLLSPGVKEIVQSHDRKDHLQIACLRENSSATKLKTRCRPVRCPFGHVLDQKLDCIFFGNAVWGIGRKMFAVHLVLQSTTKHNGSGEDFTKISVDGLKDALQIPSEWTMSYIGIADTNQTHDASQNTQILVELRQSDPDPTTVLTALKLQLKKSILLTIGKLTYTFTQNIYPLSLVIPDRHVQIHCTRENVDDMDNATEVTSYSNCWKPLFSTLSVERDSIKVNEMYFCNLVELMPGEFRLFSNGSVLFNGFRNLYLYKKQFILMEDDLGGTRAMVCLNNSGFVPVVDRGTLNNPEWALMWICVAYQFFSK